MKEENKNSNTRQNQIENKIKYGNYYPNRKHIAVKKEIVKIQNITFQNVGTFDIKMVSFCLLLKFIIILLNGSLLMAFLG